MIQSILRLFSFKGKLAPKPFYKRLVLFVLLYVVLVFVRLFVFINVMTISDEAPGYSDPKYKMKPLTDGLFAWFITYLITHIPYSLALLALMVRRMNDTKTSAVVIVLLYVAWCLANIVIVIYLASTNQLDHVIQFLLIVNAIFLIVVFSFLSQPSENKNIEIKE